MVELIPLKPRETNISVDHKLTLKPTQKIGLCPKSSLDTKSH